MELLGDPGRRTIVERLSLEPRQPKNGLSQLMGMDLPNIYHRLRSLRYNNIVACDKDHIYHVEPRPILAASKYFDVLAVASSLHA